MNGRELKKIRKRLGISQANLGKLVGVTGNSVGRWERNTLGIGEPAARLIRIVGGAPVPTVEPGMKRTKSK